MDKLNEDSEEQSLSFNDYEEQDHIMLMLGNASYHHFLMEDEENNETKDLTN
jgi:hypothetical protein